MTTLPQSCLACCYLGNRVAATIARASRSEYQAALECAWAAVAAAHWSDAAGAYRRATELLSQVLKTEPGDTLGYPYTQSADAR
jgi:hypothetical protein